MATHVLSGDLGNLVGEDIDFPNGRPARAYLSPHAPVAIEGEFVRIGGVEVSLDAAGVFAVPDVPDGTYQLSVIYYDPLRCQPTTWTTTVTIAGDDVELAA